MAAAGMLEDGRAVAVVEMDALARPAQQLASIVALTVPTTLIFRNAKGAEECSLDFGRASKELHMIQTEVISDNALKITVPEKLAADDFRQIAPQVDSIIDQYGKIRLLIDASGFSGWENIKAFENHAGFVKNHQQKVDRIAAIVAHHWQHWLIGAVRVFLHPEVRAYDKGHETEALQWLLEKY